MRKCSLRRWAKRLGVLSAAFLLQAQMGGCPIDNDALITDIVSAALSSASNSLVEALSNFLS